MSIDGATCLSCPFVSRPSHTRGGFSPSWSLTTYNVTTAVFNEAVRFQCHLKFCNHLPGLRGFQAAFLRSASYRTGLISSVMFRSEGMKKQEICTQRVNSYIYDDSLDLESQILDFMNQSERPDLFPSRSELLGAGRSDLVEAILAKGGWMVAGWDLDPDTEEQAQRLGSLCINGIAMEKRVDEAVGEFQKRQPTLLGSGEAPGLLADISEMSQSPQTVSMLERQKGWEKVAGLFGLANTTKPEHDGKPLVLANQENPRRWPDGLNGTSAQAELHGFLDSSRSDHACQSLAGNIGRNKVSEVTSAAIEKNKKRRSKSLKMSSAHSNVQKKNGQQAWVTQSKSRHTGSDDRHQNKENNMPISHRIRGLEAELASTLDILKSGRLALADDIKLKQKRSLHKVELEEVSDALEFCETEILNKKRELRTVRAQQTAFEGKLALDLMEFRRSMEVKDEQLERAMQVLKTLRTARIVWPNPGREVFLVGSYDGWASWKRMEKSGAGVFVTTLQLYPGQYEMKFVVDGAWTVDPNRPRTWASGYENNVLTIV